jgi:hypothetical protein
VRASVLRLFVLGGIKWAAAGTIVGLAGAYLLTKWIETLLFQVTPTDPATFAIVASVLLAVAALALHPRAPRRADRSAGGAEGGLAPLAEQPVPQRFIVFGKILIL